MVEKFASKSPSCIAYDEKLQFYSNLVLEVSTCVDSAGIVRNRREELGKRDKVDFESWCKNIFSDILSSREFLNLRTFLGVPCRLSRDTPVSRDN